MQLSYFSTNRFEQIEIESVETCDISQLLDAYNSLFEMGSDGGAYPGSREWAQAKIYRDRLRELIAARPEIENYRSKGLTDNHAANISSIDIMGV